MDDKLEPATDAVLASWRGTAPFGQVTIPGRTLREIIYRLDCAESQLAQADEEATRLQNELDSISVVKLPAFLCLERAVPQEVATINPT